MSGPFKMKGWSGWTKRGDLKVDPDAPGTSGKPGYEPPVRRSDFDEGSEEQKMFDKNQAKIKAKKKLSPKGKRNIDSQKLHKEIIKYQDYVRRSKWG